ncbi:putative rad4 family protein [Eutypa lata UCREL1]|uniref:Putative rad4 family protein n=1 Tax=Eutypa lata (strain UCR-EL1) TaxID=1287681 RepID=M7S6G1_EUTLA|nr:putative rad4 family protein [Eutypa lata UCREL1]
MPPHVPRKHLRTPSPANGNRVAKKSRKAKGGDNSATPVVNVPVRKTTVFDDLDAAPKTRSAEKTKSAIQQMQDDEDESSSLSSLSDAEFEDVPAPKRQKRSHASEAEEDSDNVEFEDVPSHEHQPDPMPSGDLELTLYQDKRVALAGDTGKKGPSKREKAIRIATHCFGWSKIEEADEITTTESQTNGDKSDKTTSKQPEPLTEDEDDDSVIEIIDQTQSKRPETKPYDKELEFPHYWTEVLSPVTKKWIPVDPIVKSVVGSNRELIESLEPRGGKAEKAKQVMAYCIGFSQDGTAKDVTVRYLRKQLFPGKTKGFRIPEEKVPLYNKHGKVKRYDHFDWFRSVMRGYIRGGQRCPITEIDEEEESTDLKPAIPEKKEVKEGEETLQYYKTSKEYVLERHLKREEALLGDAVPVKVFRNKGKGGKVEEENVYLRKDVAAVKSAETWHKQGRAPLPDAVPLKHAPYRAATTNRRREIAEAEAASGQKVLQPLYSFDQTDWIIPDPIKDGIIPKNEYGNIDMFAEHMCPEGAVHIPYRGVVRVCKRLGIDYAEAVVGFEFGHRMAVPVIQGVVIAEEHYERAVEELERDEAERARKEDEKRRKATLGMWRKMLMGLRIADRMRKDYGHLDDSVEVFGHAGADDGRSGHGKDGAGDDLAGEDMAGGFLPEGYEEEEEGVDAEPRRNTTSSFFPATHDDGDSDDADHSLEIQDSSQKPETKADAPATLAGTSSRQELPAAAARPVPKNLKKAAAKPKAKPKQTDTRRRRTRRKQIESSEDEDDEDFEIPDSDEE